MNKLLYVLLLCAQPKQVEIDGIEYTQHVLDIPPLADELLELWRVSVVCNCKESHSTGAVCAGLKLQPEGRVFRENLCTRPHPTHATLPAPTGGAAAQLYLRVDAPHARAPGLCDRSEGVTKSLLPAVPGKGKCYTRFTRFLTEGALPHLRPAAAGLHACRGGRHHAQA